MKRKIVTILIAMMALIGSVETFAEFRFGPTAGVSMTNLRFKQDILGVDKTVGYSAGVVGELMFPGIGFGIDLGLMYDQAGADLKTRELQFFEEMGDKRCYLHYIDIPFHLRFKYTRLNGFEDTLAPYVYAGPSFGFLVAHNDLKVMDYATADLGIDFGIGAEIKRHWQVGVSYRMGVTYAMKAKIMANYSARNSAWALRVAYLF